MISTRKRTKYETVEVPRPACNNSADCWRFYLDTLQLWGNLIMGAFTTHSEQVLVLREDLHQQLPTSLIKIYHYSQTALKHRLGSITTLFYAC